MTLIITLKGGPGSGWHAPPRGTHGGGQEGTVWSPTMSQSQTEEWNENSAIKETLLHGTTSKRRDDIIKNGFNLSLVATTAGAPSLFGDGIYMSRNVVQASAYGVPDPTTGERVMLQLKINVGNVAGAGDFQRVVEETDYINKYSSIKNPGAFLRKELMSRGYDAVDYKGEVVVFDPKNIVVLVP